MSLLKVSNLAVGYDQNMVASQIDFELHPGDYLAIVGENGTGKSTFVKTLLGFLKPLDGTFSYGEGIRKESVGYLPQQTQVQKDFPATVWEIVQSGCLNRCGLRPWYSQSEKQMARENIEQLGLTHLVNTSYRELSGGQQQRVLLARALCASSNLLILDEPANGLDPLITAQIYEEIAKINREGVTVIMVSHDLAAAVQYSNHILHLAKTPRFFGTVEEYVRSDSYRYFRREGGECL